MVASCQQQANLRITSMPAHVESKCRQEMGKMIAVTKMTGATRMDLLNPPRTTGKRRSDWPTISSMKVPATSFGESVTLGPAQDWELDFVLNSGQHFTRPEKVKDLFEQLEGRQRGWGVT